MRHHEGASLDKQNIIAYMQTNWWETTDSNREPSQCKCAALTVAPVSRIKNKIGGP